MVEKVHLDGIKLPKALLEKFPIHLAYKFKVIPIRIEGGERPLFVIASKNVIGVDLNYIKNLLGGYDFLLITAVVEDMDEYIAKSY